MKNALFTLILSLCVLGAYAQKDASKKPVAAECNVGEHLNKAVQSLKPLGYRFLKQYKLEGSASKPIEQQYTFSKGTTYFIAMHPADAESSLKVTLFDPDGKQMASSYDAKNKKFYPSVQINCGRTGVYRIVFSHESKQDYCAAGVLGFKR